MKNIFDGPARKVRASNTTGPNDDVHVLMEQVRGRKPRMAPRERTGTARQTKTV